MGELYISKENLGHCANNKDLEQTGLTAQSSGHMCSHNFVDLIEKVQPKVAVMTHLGLKMISNNPVVEAKKISKQTGVKTIAAFDGLSFNVNYNNPRKFRLISLKDVESSMHSTSHALFESGRRNSYQTSFKNKEFDELSIIKRD